ncbi:MAG: ATPase [Helicobacteraceae bacterium 4484_230]|nr:MAG: ATPase [Helicobacteraceae bacterium 4484_230]
MSKQPTLLEQFRSFCYQNNAADFEKAVEYFAVFGGMGWKVDMSRELDELIEEKILKNYRYIHGDIAKITQSNKTHHALLSALAVGDGREHSAFRRAGISREDGEDSIDFLVKNGLLVREQSQEQPLDETEEVSDKFLFTLPFMRFWFSSVSPYYKGIREGSYKEVKERFENRRQEFSNYIYERLVMELVKKSFKDDPAESIGSYWDKNGEIGILAMTASGKSIAGSCRYSKSKAKKSELTKLKEQCSRAKLKAETFVIFSKGGFSNELKKEKSTNVKLFTLKNLKRLVDDLGEKDLLMHTNKMY